MISLRWTISFSLLCGIMILTGCSREKQPTLEDLREQEIRKRIDQFILNKEEECYNTTMEMAVHQADSLLKLHAVRYRVDDLERPSLPEKPVPNLKPAPKDTVKNIPFLKKKDGLEKDSLGEDSLGGY